MDYESVDQRRINLNLRFSESHHLIRFFISKLALDIEGIDCITPNI